MVCVGLRRCQCRQPRWRYCQCVANRSGSEWVAAEARNGQHIPIAFLGLTSLYFIMTASFPDQLKLAELSPLFKNNDSLLTGNYRPVSVLTCFFKVFEKVYHDQLYEYFREILASLLTAFRKQFSTQHVLLKVMEDCKAALDRHEHIGLILMDLRKAFDCLPHQLLLSKLHFLWIVEKCMHTFKVLSS